MKNGILLIALFLGLFSSCKNEKVVETTVGADEVKAQKISLAEWSFHKALFDGKMTNLEFIQKAADMGFDGVEYVNAFFKDKATNMVYLDSMNTIAKANNITNVLIMIDGEGYLGDLDVKKRDSAVDNHKKWVDAAAYLGCHSIRVNAHGEGSEADVSAAAVDGLTKIATYAASKNINVIVENHGGHSSNGQWLSEVMKAINMPNIGTLPDFGNFCLEREGGAMWNAKCVKEYNRYKGVEELLPYAKGLSAKSYAFDSLGNETTIDFTKMATLAKAANYTGFVGVEFEGEDMEEEAGVIATMALIKRTFL